MSVTTTRAADRRSVGGAAGVVGGVVGAARSSDGRVFVGASLVTMAGVSAMSSTRKSGSGANRDRRAGCPWLSISKPYHDSWHLQPLIARSRVRASRCSRCAASRPGCRRLAKMNPGRAYRREGFAAVEASPAVGRHLVGVLTANKCVNRTLRNNRHFHVFSLSPAQGRLRQ